MRALLVCCWLGVFATAHAERLPVRTFTTADGLANNHVDRGAIDSRGFVWFATFDGVSRFDGESFVNFGVADGLPADKTLDVLAASDGRVWVATEGGIAWLDPREKSVRPRFHAIPGPTANRLIEGGGHIWVATDGGLFRIDNDALVPVLVGNGRQPTVITIAYDKRDGSMWLGTWGGLVHRRVDGSLERYPVTSYAEDDRVFDLLIDREGRLWITHVNTVVIAIPLGGGLGDGKRPLWDQAKERTDWLHFEPHGWARRHVLEDSHGTIWIGTVRDIVRFRDGVFVELTEAQTGVDYAASPCVEDSAGNLWFGSEGGVHRLMRLGPVTFDHDDGLGSGVIYAFVQPVPEQLHLVVAGEIFSIARREANGFTFVSPKVDPAWGTAWGSTQLVVRDREDRWWYPLGQGVARFDKVARLEDLATANARFYSPADGLPGRDILRLYLDGRGDVWISTMSATGLARWDHETDRIVAVGAEWPRTLAIAYAEDRAGALWIGYEDGSLVRVKDGVPRTFRGGELPGGAYVGLLFDREGHLWIASDHDGVARVDDPDAEILRVRRYAFGSGSAQTLVDDIAGNIYVGSTHGIDRIEPATGAVTHLGIRESLPAEFVFAAIRDRDNTLWFATKKGAVQLPAKPDPPMAPPPIYIERVAISGDAVPLEAGRVPALDLGPDQNQLDIEFTAPSFTVGSTVRFSYRLDGDAWSEPTTQRFVHFAKLGAGHYDFEVRSVLPEGRASAPASIAITIAPPFWRRWWFLLGTAALIGALIYAFYRWRLQQALALERVRTRIASDLHDDLGASLSRISMLSEVASRRAANRDEISGPIDDIGRSARELVDVAADIVWSTDPMRDDLQSVIVRLREFAGDVLEARGIEWSLVGPEDPARVKLAPDARRHLFLIIKEAINNAAKHSHARRATIEIRIAGRGIRAIVRDDGRGFDEATLARRGHGLDNMRTRAREAGGEVTMTTAPDAGTEIVCELPAS